VEAAALLPKHLAPAPVFAVFGEDRCGFRPEMESRAAAAGMADRLFFMGFRQPVWPWLTGCDLLLALAVNEPFGRSLVEAMLCGVAVVASDSGGHREIVYGGDTGLLVPVDNAEALSAAVARMLGDRSARQRLAESGRDAALRRFGVDEHVNRVAALYESLRAAA
jgi:glycosyltransferase involved in cell wall biosynthesis